MQTTQTLPQLGNTVVIQGKIKEKALEKKSMTYTNKEGVQVTKNAITGTVTIEVNEAEKGRKHNHVVNVFSFEADNKVYKGLETVLAEHQVGDFVKVQATVDVNDFVNKNGEVTERNKLNGVFFNRITEEDKQIPCAEAKIKMVVQDYLPVNNPDGTIKEYKVKGFTVGYNGRIIPLHNLVISAELGQAIAGFYPVGMNSMGELSFDVNNYLEVGNAPTGQSQTMAFGRMASNVTTGGRFVNNLEIIGGLPAERQFTPEEMQVAQQSRNLALEEVKRKHAEKQNKLQSQSQVPPQSTPAFGTTGAVTNQGNPFGATIMEGDSLPF